MMPDRSHKRIEGLGDAFGPGYPLISSVALGQLRSFRSELTELALCARAPSETAPIPIASARLWAVASLCARAGCALRLPMQPTDPGIGSEAVPHGSANGAVQVERIGQPT